MTKVRDILKVKKIPSLVLALAMAGMAILSGCEDKQSITIAEEETPAVYISEESIQTPGPTEEPIKVLNERNGRDRAEIIWNRLSLYFDNPIATAAIMGNMSRESRLCPWRYEGDRSEDYYRSKEIVDICNEELKYPTREAQYWFMHIVPRDCTGEGFGLCQWTALGYKNMMFEYAAQTNRRIDDTEMQVDFMMQTLWNKGDLIHKMEHSSDLQMNILYFINEYEKGITYEGDLYRRELTAQCFLALYAPAFATDEYLAMTKDEIYDLLELIDY